MKKKWLAFGGLLILAALIAYMSVPQAILSVSKAQIGSDGKPYWVMFIAPAIDGGKLVFFGDARSLDPYVDISGGKTVPKNSFEIVFDTKAPTCSYQMKDVTSSISNIFTDTRYYTISLEAEKTQLADVLLNGQKKTTLDLYDIGQTQDFMLADGLTMQVQGALGGKSDCPSGYDVEIKYNTKTSVIEIRKRSSLWPSLRDDFTSQFSGGCMPSVGFNQLVCTKSVKDLGSGTLTVTASTQFLDYYYIPPETVAPEIIDIEVPSPAGELTAEAVKVSIKNNGNTEATYGVKFTSPKASFSPSSTTVTVKPKTYDKISTVMVAVDVSSSTTSEVCVEAYTMSQFGGNKADKECKSFVIEHRGIIISPKTCGNGVCDSNENYVTCAKDCQSQLVCPDKYLMHVVNGRCECLDGYNLKTDEYGNEYCAKSLNWLPFAIIGASIIIAAAILGGRKKR